MRKAAFICVLVGLLAVPAVAYAVELAEGRLSVSEGRGLVSMTGRGAMIGRLDKGTVTVTDLSPIDANEPLVFGCHLEEFRGAATVCRGENIRFRLIGGSWRVVVRGSGIDLSAAGRGTVRLDGDGLWTGLYSTSGVDCRKADSRCEVLPDDPITFTLGPQKS
jgi:hypothetical protein